ncbi:MULTISPECIES: SRPBCC family protein [unclassified Microbulbifer]|uniref:SRPBCC family protein n=1 Tax=unclassified Microbulbifer TaxID=2619833 RepID=UPI0027E499CC|nr:MULTISPECIES: SRPBCC family protein [unclassified Microbulbifer]
MASIRKEITVDAPVDVIWDALRDVGALHTRLVPGFVTDTKLEPGARIVTFSNRQVVRELIVDVNDTDRRVAWAVTDEPFRHYNASAQVFADPSGSSRFVWIADLLPDELKDHVSAMMDAGLGAIKTKFDGSGV